MHVLLMILTTVFSGIVPGHRHTITLQFRHMVGERELKLYTETYINPFGEPVTINRFKYYVSHIHITGADGMERTLSDKAWLVDEADSLSKKLVFTTDVASPQTLSFVIGVDSALNVGGVQTADLDPYKGMFWTWNSGYIFAKMEGRSDSSHAPSRYFNYDVGGFRSQANATRTIHLSLPANTAVAANPVIVLNADLLKWFNAKHPVKISQQPLCHQPGNLAMQIADNYSCMFSVAL